MSEKFADDYGRISDEEWRARRIALFAECAVEGDPGNVLLQGASIVNSAWMETGNQEEAIQMFNEVIRHMVQTAMISDAEYEYLVDHRGDLFMP
jgi:hypothetical protein